MERKNKMSNSCVLCSIADVNTYHTEKIVFIGAGSYTFGISILWQMIIEEKIENVELALVDHDENLLDVMSEAAVLLAKTEKLPINITVHSNWKSALQDADFVISALTQDSEKRFRIDCEILDRLCPDEYLGEFGGISGISYSIEQIQLIQTLTDDMKSLCPDAWLLNLSNPLPRVCQAAFDNGIYTIGFCSAASVAYNHIWQVFHGKALPYPWKKARAKYKLRMAGTNHFTWITRLEDQKSGHNLLTQITGSNENLPDWGNPIAKRLLNETSCFACPVDHHIQDFLAIQPESQLRRKYWHGTEKDRNYRLKTLKEITIGQKPVQAMQEFAIAWEKPLKLISAMERDETFVFDALNLVNTGQIRNLPEGVFVETRAKVSGKGIRTKTETLPDGILEMVHKTVLLTKEIVKAGLTKNRSSLHQAVLLDPVICDKNAGITALEESLTAHHLFDGWI